jgi:hypothetical protein
MVDFGEEAETEVDWIGYVALGYECLIPDCFYIPLKYIGLGMIYQR